MTNDLFGKKRNEKLPVKPRFRALFIGFWQMAKLGQRLESLKYEFNLPSETIPFKNIGCRKPIQGEGCKHNHIGCEAPGRLPRFFLFPPGILVNGLECILGCFFGFSGSSIILVKRLVFELRLDRDQVLRDGSKLRWRGVFYFGSRGYRL